jgi:hypothetical protein
VGLVALWPAAALKHAANVDANPYPIPGACLFAVIPSTFSSFVSQTQQIAASTTSHTDDTKKAADAAGARRSL